MKQHRYRVTLEHLEDAKGNPSTYDAPLQFEVGNHDDIFAVVEKVKNLSGLPADKAVPFAVGLKLFGETILENRDHPLFEEMGPHFMQFMKKLKGKG
ncbi:DUF3861 domain-containing protein [Oceanobacter mangrovi]|uniref:DUF3861 domain-containing protein n=1 Tax=Oceanobacter mangrovi TaxID=2862510 RepID=UPI001C8DF71C|nr:DUF3861 domain-containing protein [Oceanobacter mangrovi]